MKTPIIILLSSLIFTSCASHFGMLSNSSISRPVVYEDIAVGVAQSNQFLGMGGLAQDALVFEAKRELMRNRPLKNDEEFANFTVDFKRTFLIVNLRTKVTVTADVVSFDTDSGIGTYSDNYTQKLSGINMSNELFTIGDSVLFKKEKKGVLISAVNDHVVRIQFTTGRNKIRTKNVSINEVFTTSKSFRGFNIGERIIFTSLNEGSWKSRGGTIIGLGTNSAKVSTVDKSITTQDYKNIKPSVIGEE